MTRNIISILITLCLFSCSERNAKLHFLSPSISMDTVNSNTEKSATATIMNTGYDNLIISNFSCSCECTVPNLKKETIIAPNASLSFNIIVKGYSDDKGKWKKVLCTFKSNSDSIFSPLNIIYFTK